MAKVQLIDAVKSLESVFRALGLPDINELKSVTINLAVKEHPTITWETYMNQEQVDDLNALWVGRLKP